MQTAPQAPRLAGLFYCDLRFAEGQGASRAYIIILYAYIIILYKYGLI